VAAGTDQRLTAVVGEKIYYSFGIQAMCIHLTASVDLLCPTYKGVPFGVKRPTAVMFRSSFVAPGTYFAGLPSVAE
jgi:hypothetical protein